LWADIGSDVLEHVLLGSGDAHRTVEIGKAGLQVVPGTNELRLGIGQLHLYKVQVQF
jgi:hypothetical protein